MVFTVLVVIITARTAEIGSGDVTAADACVEEVYMRAHRMRVRTCVCVGVMMCARSVTGVWVSVSSPSA